MGSVQGLSGDYRGPLQELSGIPYQSFQITPVAIVAVIVARRARDKISSFHVLFHFPNMTPI